MVGVMVVMATSFKRTYACMLLLPGLLRQATIDPHLRQRLLDTHSKSGSVYCRVTAPFSRSWCAKGFVCTLQESLESLRFDSKHDFCPSCQLVGTSPLNMGYLFFGRIQHSPVNGCLAAGHDLGVLTG